ncbi:hypothetical protein [Rhizobium arsenicireducens]
MTPQSVFDTVFDTVTRHLLAQNAISHDPDQDLCMYRGPNGLKCAVGILISDKDYHPEMEGKSVDQIGLFTENRELLNQLQAIHDGDEPSRWRLCLTDLADEYGLTKEALA